METIPSKESVTTKVAQMPQFGGLISIDKELEGLILTDEQIGGFERAASYAYAISRLREMLTPDNMKNIMLLQGNKLGFLTDKDKKRMPDGSYGKGEGYPLGIVKDCLISAVLQGVQPVLNHFNIIGGNCYLTKEGCQYILNNHSMFKGKLKYKCIPMLPKIDPTKTSATVAVKCISSYLGGKEEEEIIEFPIKCDQWTSNDALIGKAKRKAYAYLIERYSGITISEGDVSEPDFVISDAKVTRVTPSESRQQAEESATSQREKVIIGTAKKAKSVQDVVGVLANSSIESERKLYLTNIPETVIASLKTEQPEIFAEYERAKSVLF